MPYEDAFSIIKEIAPPYKDPSLPLAVDESHTVQKCIGEAMRSAYSAKNYGLMDALNDLNKRILFYTAPKVFADFLVAMEYDAPKSKRFYAPRKHYLAPMVEGYQKILDHKLRLLTISMPKRAGKSTTSIMFALLLSGLYPDKSILMEGTGDGLVRSFYNGMLEYLVQPSLYHFYEIFPNSKLVQTNADSLILNLNDKSRFPTVMCRSIDARQVGLSEATSLLALDDCVEGREEAKNRQRLDQKWEIISGDVMGRALENTPIVMTGTRYSLYDPIGRMQEHAKEHGWNWEAIEIPALDLVTDESNYEWENHEGKKFFTTEYFREQRELLSEEQWESEFQQQPFEGAGRLFPADSLNYYFELPIDTDPDAVIAVCDTAESGSDYTALAVLKVYGDDVFVDDLVYDNSPSDITKPQCARKIVDNNVTVAVFESNAAGGYFSRDVEQLVNDLGGKCSIRTKRTISNKQTRIEFASDGIIKNFYFKDPTKYTRDSQYAEAMRELTTYVRTGKVPHDDFTDCMSLCENEIRNIGTSKAEVVSRKW